MLYRRGEIIQKLRQLAKNNSLITLYFSNQSMLTIVVDVLSDKNLLVLDASVDETLNEKLLQADRAIIKTDFQGIVAQFSIRNMRNARLQGHPSIACTLPEKILWVQRREFYRVKIPLSETVTCELIHGDNHRTVYSVLDISAGGFALLDKNNELEPGTIFHHAKILLGEDDSAYIDIEIHSHIMLNPDEPDKGTRCGCTFLNISGEFSATLQRFINQIDLQQNRSAK